ncbi:glycosyltransferase family 2 protein [Candidatus Woesearchaeota archaeon]|nr:glycosyltransferase family 2 protein [Candidatus Woesearchaeota archaeon]
MYKSLKISLVIPAYNEEKLIRPTLENIPKTIDKVYVVDDGSKDKTADVVKEMAVKDKRIELISHEKNSGVGAAIITGYKRSSKDNFDVAVVIGGDNQMDLKDLPNFLEPIYQGKADYTKGNRFLSGGTAYTVMPKHRFFGNSVLSLMTKVASGYWNIFDTQDGYTAMTKDAIDSVDWDKAWKGYGYVSDFLVLFNVHNLRVKDVPRRAIYLEGERQSQINILRYILKVGPRLVKEFFWRITTKYFFQDFHPLIFFYFLGLFFLPAGTLMGIWIAYKGLTGPVSGNQAILTALFIITGLQFLLFAFLFDMQQNKSLQ